jgi:hypothetical protein
LRKRQYKTADKLGSGQRLVPAVSAQQEAHTAAMPTFSIVSAMPRHNHFLHFGCYLPTSPQRGPLEAEFEAIMKLRDYL